MANTCHIHWSAILNCKYLALMCICWISYFKMLLLSNNNTALTVGFQIQLKELEVKYRAKYRASTKSSSLNVDVKCLLNISYPRSQYFIWTWLGLMNWYLKASGAEHLAFLFYSLPLWSLLKKILYLHTLNSQLIHWLTHRHIYNIQSISTLTHIMASLFLYISLLIQKFIISPMNHGEDKTASKKQVQKFGKKTISACFGHQ